LIKFRLEENNETQRTLEKGFRDYEAQYQSTVLEIPEMNGRFTEKIEEVS
jgi:predicted phosphoadenosine phosphosulfate sulfurtransferase